MNTHADKTQENKSKSIANAVSQKQNGGESTFQFVDNRPEAIAQRELQEMANNSPEALQLRTFQEMANNNPQAKHTAQLQAMADGQNTQAGNSNNHVKNTFHFIANSIVQRTVDTAAEALRTEGIITVKTKTLDNKFCKAHDVSKKDLRAIQAELDKLRAAVPLDPEKVRKQEQEQKWAEESREDNKAHKKEANNGVGADNRNMASNYNPVKYASLDAETKAIIVAGHGNSTWEIHLTDPETGNSGVGIKEYKPHGKGSSIRLTGKGASAKWFYCPDHNIAGSTYSYHEVIGIS